MASIVVSTDNITATTATSSRTCLATYTEDGANTKFALTAGGGLTANLTASGDIEATGGVTGATVTAGSTDISGAVTTAGSGLAIASNNLTLDDTASVTFGSVTAGSFTTSSDRTLKDNIVAFDDAEALNRVLQMNAHSFVLKSAPDVARCGVIAQEMAEVAPELVVETDNGTLAVNYSDLTAYLLSANKALHAQNEALFARVEALEARMA